MSRINFASVSCALLFATASIAAHATTINFSGLANGTAVTNQYPGVVFSLEGGPDSDGPPITNNYSGEGLANSANPDYPTANILNVAFAAPVSDLSFTFNNNGSGAATTYTAFNADDAVVSTGSLQNVESFSIINTVTGSGITDLQFNNNVSDTTNWYYAVEELTYTQGAVVPEPASLALLAVGLAGLAALRRRRS